MEDILLTDVADRVSALVAELGEDAQVGFHGHENLGLGVANSVEAVRAGAKQIDGSVRRFGAGAGNAPVEALIGVFDKILRRSRYDVPDDLVQTYLALSYDHRLIDGKTAVQFLVAVKDLIEDPARILLQL